MRVLERNLRCWRCLDYQTTREARVERIDRPVESIIGFNRCSFNSNEIDRRTLAAVDRCNFRERLGTTTCTDNATTLAAGYGVP